MLISIYYYLNKKFGSFGYYRTFVVPEIQNSNYFIDDLRNAAGLEDDSYNPLPPGSTGL